jgi:transposase
MDGQNLCPANRGESHSSNPAALYVSLELSSAKWLITLLAPGSEKMSRHIVSGGSGDALLDLLDRLKEKCERSIGSPIRIVAIMEAGRDGFWIHRLLEANQVESHVVEAASMAVSRRHRRAKTDAIDGETLLRTLLAWKRGEPRVCAMVRPPTPDEEDQRRISREREILVEERIGHTNRIKGLLASQGIRDFEPLRKGCRERLEELRTGDGRPLPFRLKAEIARELQRIELLMRQLDAVEAERDALVQPTATEMTSPRPACLLLRLRGIGHQAAAVLYLEALFRQFDNRRQVAAYAGLAPSPWKSGQCDRDQGVSKAGNPRVRKMMIELAWLWLRYQPGSAVSRWFQERVGAERGRVRRISIVAVARKLLVALWRYVTLGEIPEGAVLKTV